MWVGDVYSVTGDIISLAGTTQKTTNFKVMIGDVIVFYAKKSFDVKRFMNTNRYLVPNIGAVLFFNCGFVITIICLFNINSDIIYMMISQFISFCIFTSVYCFIQCHALYLY